MPAIHSCDVAIVGGGLSGALIALALARKRPDVRLKLIEGGPALGGNHLWSFFASDIAPADRWLTAPLVCHGWKGYDIAFPAHRRTLDAFYYSIESTRLDLYARTTLPEGTVMTRRQVSDLSSSTVILADGEQVEAGGVIDCRGAGDLSPLDLGWQKFLGRELALGEPHALARPIVMDATVEQIDGYRFMYALPFAATRLFLEDTYYSDGPEPDTAGMRERITAYAAANDWPVERILREEIGALPVVMGGDFEAYWTSGGNGIAKAGVRGAMFHPLTSYSLPDAVRTASLVAKATDLSGAGLHDLLYRHARQCWRDRGFYRILTAMLFRAAEPEERYRVLERFYTLDPGLIARFYAGQSTLFDRLRVLSGKPPVPIGRAISAIRSTRR
ncbi:MAG: lycopene beta-cyclase CrtY [Sphingomonas sp.]